MNDSKRLFLSNTVIGWGLIILLYEGISFGSSFVGYLREAHT